MRRSISLFSLFLLLPTLTVMGQSMKADLEKHGLDTYCGTDILWRKTINESPQKAERIHRIRQKLDDHIAEYQEEKRAGTVYIVPVVFHVIHDNGPEKIDPARVENAMDILTRDFRKNNQDTTTIKSPFKSIAADAEIEFRLAQKDPNGNCHRGITYTQSTKTYDGDAQMKGLIQWDPSSYLNVWICNDIDLGGGGGVAGYTTPPAQAEANPSEDGIVLKYNYLGTQSPSSVWKSRTLTHETGHYFGLDHPWGTCGQAGDGSNCNGSNCSNTNCSPYRSYDDGICDTPHTIGWTDCNNPSGSSCGSQDNVQNYMEYSYCHRMFTDGQRSAMRGAITSNIADRNQLWQDANLQETGVKTPQLCLVDFSAGQRTICKGESIQFEDLSYHGPTSWDWEFEGGNATDPTVQNPTVTYTDTGSFDVTLIASNSSGTDTAIKKDLIKVLPSPGMKLPFIDPMDWMVSFQNSFKLHQENPDADSIAWKPTTQAGEGGSRGAIMLENYSNSVGNKDIFYTTSIDATQIPDGNIEMSFDVAFAKINSGDQDELKVFASNDCGNTWSPLKTYSAQFGLSTAPEHTEPFVPEADEWSNKTFNSALNSNYNVKDLRFKFEFTSDGGNNIYIDNINVYDQQSVGIREEEGEKADLKVHPNPVQEKTVLSLELPLRKKISIELLDLRGKTVRKIREGDLLRAGFHRLTIDMSDLQAGPYFVKVRIGDRKSTKKLFKK